MLAFIEEALCCWASNWFAGRCTNLYLLVQSAAGMTFSPVAFKSVAGLILLATTFEGRYMFGVLPSLEDWGRWAVGLA